MKSPKSCLLVDDDAEDQELFLAALTEISSDTFCIAASGAHVAIGLLEDKTYHPDFIFLDLNLPDMTGMELLQVIRKNPDYKNTPVIIYSSSAMENTIEKSLRLGADGYFTKSTNYNDVCTMLRAFF